MGKSRFAEGQIIEMIKKQQAGMHVFCFMIL
jgi:hypothetical protein